MDKFNFNLQEKGEEHFNSGCTNIDVAEPPCKNCVWWRPRILTTERGFYDGVALCNSKEMHHDFSCFKAHQPKQEAVKNETKP